VVCLRGAQQIARSVQTALERRLDQTKHAAASAVESPSTSRSTNAAR